MLIVSSAWTFLTICVSFAFAAINGQTPTGKQPITERPGRFLSLPIAEKCSQSEYIPYLCWYSRIIIIFEKKKKMQQQFY